MTTLTEQIRQGADQAWTSLSEGWHDLRRRASNSLTRFRRSDGAAGGESASALAFADSGEWGVMAADVQLDDDRVVVRVEVPGMRREDLHVDIDRDRLRVWGEKHVDRESGEGGYRVLQCAYGHFQRELLLPRPVDPAKASASYRDGVLRIQIPRLEASRARRIMVQ